MDDNKTNLNDSEKLHNVRTYMSDMADTVRANEVSVIKIALAEQNKREREKLMTQTEGTSFKKFFWFLGALFFIGGSIYGLIFLYELKQKNDIVVPVKKDSVAVAYDKIIPLDIDINNSKDLVQKIINKKNENLLNESVGSINFISITKDVDGIKTNINVNDFFDKLYFTAPAVLIRSFTDKFMIGYHVTKTNETYNDANLFIVLESKDYENSYAGMLEWEDTIISDLYELFELDNSVSKTSLIDKNFNDLIVKNKDTRVLYDESGVPLLFYMFVDRNNIIISKNKDTVIELISRLKIMKIKPL